MSQERSAPFSSRSAPPVSHPPLPQAKGCPSLLCTLKHQPGWAGVPLPITPTPPRHFLLAQTPQSKISTPLPRDGSRDAEMRAASPLPADLAELHPHPPPQNARGRGGLLAPTPPNPPSEIQKHAGLRSNALQQGPALLVPRHTKARWCSRRCRGGGFIPGGSIPVFRVSSPRESGSDPQEHGAERGEGSSGIWARLAGAALLSPLLSVLWGRRGKKKTKKGRRKKNNNKKKNG